MTKHIFCAHCQADTPHNAELGTELILTCVLCGRHLKLPVTKDAEVLRALLLAHKASNTGQVPAVEYVPDPDVLTALENA